MAGNVDVILQVLDIGALPPKGNQILKVVVGEEFFGAGWQNLRATPKNRFLNVREHCIY